MKKVSVIGAGVAGLSAGIYLAESGFDVTIYEKNPYAGGFVTVWTRKKSIIDGCMHWMLGTKEGTRLNSIWKHVGVLDHVNIIHPDSFCTVEYDGKVFHYYNDIDRFEKEMYSYSENDDEEIKTFIDAIKELGVMEIPSDLPYELVDISTLKLSMNLMRKMRSYLKASVSDVANRFNSPVIRYALNNCLVNNKFSAFYFMQTISNFVNKNDSLPEGCSISIRDGMLDKYLSLGGKIEYNANVKEIMVEGTNAKGIVLDNDSFIASDYIIGAGDLHYLEDVILKGKYTLSPFKEYDSNKVTYPTYSYCIASYRTKHDFKDSDIAVLKKVPEYEVLGKKQDCLSIRQYAYDKTLVTEDGYSTVQVYLTTFEEEYEKLKLMTKEEYKAFKKELGALYLGMLEEYYNDSFELIDVLTPLTYERYNHSYKGSFMTYAVGPRIPQVTRSALVDGIDNLILANQWLMLPGGTPIAIVSGKFACQLVLHKEGMEYHI